MASGQRRRRQSSRRSLARSPPAGLATAGCLRCSGAGPEAGFCLEAWIWATPDMPRRASFTHNKSHLVEKGSVSGGKLMVGVAALAWQKAVSVGQFL